MGKYFESIDLKPDADHPTSIFFRKKPQIGALPKEALAFRDSVDEGVRVLTNVLDPPSNDFEKSLRDFHGAAGTGLGGDNPSLEEGQLALNGARQDLADIAQRTRIDLCMKMAIAAAIGCIVIGLIGALLSDRALIAIGVDLGDVEGNFVKSLFYALVGIGVSLFFVAFVRNAPAVKYDTLLSATRYTYIAFHTLGYIAGATLVIMIVLYFRIIMLGAGNILLNDFVKDPKIAIVIGLICGVATPAIVDIILRALEPKERKDD